MLRISVILIKVVAQIAISQTLEILRIEEISGTTISATTSISPIIRDNSSQFAFCANTSASQHTWLLNFSASSHMTNSYEKLQNPESYTGPEQVYIRDGKGLLILHLGFSSMPTSTQCFDLKHVLHVQELNQDLLSANKFILDNL